jgi:hypothetical protein
MPTYDVAVKTTVLEFYRVDAPDAEEALENWRDGTFMNTEDTRLAAVPLCAVEAGEGDHPGVGQLADGLDALPDPPDYLAEDAARRRFGIEHAAWMEEHGAEFQRVMEELEAEHPAPPPEPEGPDDEPSF